MSGSSRIKFTAENIKPLNKALYLENYIVFIIPFSQAILKFNYDLKQGANSSLEIDCRLKEIF